MYIFLIVILFKSCVMLKLLGSGSVIIVQSSDIAL